MAAKLTSIRLDAKLADEAVHMALKEIAKLNDFKGLMKKYGGKGSFAGSDE